jgi:hypothetical protein
VVCPDVIFKLWIYDTWKIDLSLEFRESGGQEERAQQSSSPVTRSLLSLTLSLFHTTVQWVNSVKHSSTVVKRHLSNHLQHSRKLPPNTPPHSQLDQARVIGRRPLLVFYFPLPIGLELSISRNIHYHLSRKLSREFGHLGSRVNVSRLLGIMNGNYQEGLVRLSL